MKRTAIYIRVSTDAQAREGDSIPAQRAALRKYIDDRPDLIFAGEYLDDGISGTKEDRDELQRMLSDVKAGCIDLIIVTKMDRLHRSLRNFLNMQDTLDKHGCDWLAIWEPMYDTSTPQGKMIVNTMMNLAQFEAENTGQRIRTVFQYKAQQGEVLSGKQPFGYSIVDKHLVPNEKADIVRAIFEYFNTCGSLHQTSKYAMQLGYVHIEANIKKLLQNPKYVGRFRDNSNYCPPIIPQELFDSVQRKLPMNVRGKTKHAYIFSSLVICPKCGRKEISHQSYRYKKDENGKSYLYSAENGYLCQHAYRAPYDCENKTLILERKIEQFLLKNLDDIAIEYEAEQKPIKNNAAAINNLSVKITRLKELYVNGLITLDEYKADKETYTAQIESLKEPQQTQPDIAGVLEKFGTVKDVYATMTNEEKRYFWRSIIKTIAPTHPIRNSPKLHCEVTFL